MTRRGPVSPLCSWFPFGHQTPVPTTVVLQSLLVWAFVKKVSVGALVHFIFEATHSLKLPSVVLTI